MKVIQFVLAVLLACASIGAWAEDSAIAKLPWQRGPTTGKIADKATIQVPLGYVFLDVSGTKKLNELMHNPPDSSSTYTFAPEDLSWIGFFSFNDVGYIKDENDIDADKILASVKEGTEQGNTERQSRGWDTLKVLGWSFEPKYDSQIKSLAWAILAEDEKSHAKIVNYNTRLLGRRGVMEVVVVSDPESLNSSIAAFKGNLPGFQFTQGESYAEYRPGDHVAAYGLAALITGGAAAVAAKKGFFGVIAGFLAAAWKLVVAAFLGMGAWLRSLFSKKQKPGQ
jgi:uncharacterized membrane-anchored protein